MVFRTQMEDIYGKLKENAAEDMYPFHMPGHKRSGILSLQDPYSFDITEIDGFDDLHHPEDMYLRAMQEASVMYETRRTFFCINGSSGAILSAVFAVTHPGDGILLSRNCHKSVYNAILIRGLIPFYMRPEYEEKLALAGSVLPEEMERAFAEARKGENGKEISIAACVITSPTYEGITSDLKKLAEIAHANGSILIVDEAHGAHLPFMRRAGEDSFPESALTSGADLVIQSLHKTMPALTQTALLHICTDRPDVKRVEEALRIFQTSSPSYVLTASISECLRWAGNSEACFHRYAETIGDFRTWAKKNLKALMLPDKEWFCRQGLHPYDFDPGKLILTDASGNRSGGELYRELREKYHLQPEMSSTFYALLMTSPADREEGFSRLEKALKEMDEEIIRQNQEENGIKKDEEKDRKDKESGRKDGENDRKNKESGRKDGENDRKNTESGRKDEEKDRIDQANSRKDEENDRKGPDSVLKKENAFLEGNTDERNGSFRNFPLPERVYTSAEAEVLPHRTVRLENAAGMVSGEYAYLYPPEVPLLVPGERITREMIRILIGYRMDGRSVKGCEDSTLLTWQVLSENTQKECGK